jgi:peptidoglycan/xylan/chitin deacetylase (PgdA/CDA1 family)
MRNSAPPTRRILLAFALTGLVVGLLPAVASAATVQNPAPAALVSFTFDDGNQSAYTQAAPTLQKHGLTGTSYVITNCVGMTTAPNTCRANTDLPYMTWDQVTALHSTYGWEIGSHTVDHQCLASNSAADPDDCQKSTLTAAQVDAELANSKSALASHGIDATALAVPYGDYSNTVVAKAAKYYTSMRGFHEQGTNQWPLDDYLLNNISVQETTSTVASLEAQVDQAIANGTWAVFTFHDIETKPSTDPDDYQFGTAELDQLAAYVQAKQAAGQLKAVNVSQGLVTGDTNLLPNGSFNDGVGDGWTTDYAAGITKDTGGNGSYPDPTNAIKLVSGTSGTQHLFSPTIGVNPQATYLVKAFLNVSALKTGEVAFYVDEYDASGTWISGQFRKRENSSFVENMNFTYAPTSTKVARARLQVIVAGTGITAYLDSVQMFALSNDTTPPPTNLVANGTFDSGIGAGWSTDAAGTIVADSGNHGSPANPVNSVKLQATTANTHLFSPPVAVSSANSYTIDTYLNSLTTGEVAFYIDEYDASGAWISGQYKYGNREAGVIDVGLTYQPSTTAVASASLQVIVVGNSGASDYLDDVRWWQN